MEARSTPPQAKLILHWTHSQQREAHCLVRIYRQDNRAAIIFSEIRSNDREATLMTDLVGAANALVSLLTQLKINPAQTKWFIHHGSFSDYEPLEYEEWAQVCLPWDGQQYRVDWKSWQVLDQASVDSLHRSFQLDSVFSILTEIGWTRR